jgi:hypothetical protein
MRRVEEAKKRDGPRNDHFTEIETLRFRKHDVPIPKAYSDMTKGMTVKVPLVDDTLRTVISDITASFPMASVPPRRVGEQANTSKREKFFNALLPRLDACDGLGRAFVREIDHACSFGLATPKMLYLPHAWDNTKLKRRKKGETDEDYVGRAKGKDETDAEFQERVENYKITAPTPFIWLTPDPRTAHYWLQNRRIYEYVEISKCARYELAERYKDRGVYYDDVEKRLSSNVLYGEPYAENALGHGDENEVIDRIEYWNDEWGVYIADGIILDAFYHNYGRVPSYPYFGLSSSSTDPLYECQSVVENMLDMVKAIDLCFTTALHWGYIAALPMGVLRTPEGGTAPTVEARIDEEVEKEESSSMPVMDYKPGEVVIAPPGVDFSWVTAPEMGRDLKELGQQMMEIAQKMGGVPDIMRGVMPDHEVPAWGLMQLYMAARRVYNPVANNHAISMTQRAEWIYQAIENLHQDTVYVQNVVVDKKGKTKRDWLGLGPKDINGYYAVTIDLQTLTMDRRIQQGQYGLQLFQANLISERECLENYLMYPAPEEMMRETRREKFRNSPPYQQMLWEQFVAIKQGKMAQRRQAAGLPPEGQMQAPTQPLVNQNQQPNPAGPENITGAPAAVPPGPGMGGVGVTQPMPQGVGVV